jgi:hypothetical protein
LVLTYGLKMGNADHFKSYGKNLANEEDKARTYLSSTRRMRGSGRRGIKLPADDRFCRSRDAQVHVK